jgi:tetratricopeptide (TPR) repeat protein
MKAEHRHDLQTNTLAEWLEDAIERLKPYARAITGVLVAIAIVLAVYAYLGLTQRRAEVAASEQLITAMETGSPHDYQAAVDDYRGTQPATIAQLIMAERMLDDGSNALFTNKQAGRENLFKASDAFAGVEKDSRDPMLRAWAIYGLGRVHESMGDLERAREDFQRLLKDYPDSSLADAAHTHLNRLGQQSVKEFYDWFAKQEPRPAPTENEPGVPGLKPSFNLDEPAPQQSTPQDIKLPTALPQSKSDTPASSTSTPESAAPAGAKASSESSASGGSTSGVGPRYQNSAPNTQTPAPAPAASPAGTSK